MVRFDRTLEIMEQDALVANAASVGKHLFSALQKLSEEFAAVRSVRGRGLMCALDLPTRALRDRVLERCFAEGVILLGCGHASIRFRSPLTISAAEIDAGLDKLRRALAKEL